MHDKLSTDYTQLLVQLINLCNVRIVSYCGVVICLVCQALPPELHSAYQTSQLDVKRCGEMSWTNKGLTPAKFYIYFITAPQNLLILHSFRLKVYVQLNPCTQIRLSFVVYLSNGCMYGDESMRDTVKNVTINHHQEFMRGLSIGSLQKLMTFNDLEPRKVLCQECKSFTDLFAIVLQHTYKHAAPGDKAAEWRRKMWTTKLQSVNVSECGKIECQLT